MLQTILGTPYYKAPEILKREKSYTSKADLWSLGMIMYELIFGHRPYQAYSEADLVKKIKEGKIPITKELKKKESNLLFHLLKEFPEDRIDWEPFFNHPYFNKVEEIEFDENST